METNGKEYFKIKVNRSNTAERSMKNCKVYKQIKKKKTSLMTLAKVWYGGG